jgi:hypothetical protein
VEKERVGHGEDADDHGTHGAENGSKNQSFEWGKYAHSLRLGRTADPRLSGALLAWRARYSRPALSPL